MWLGFVSWSSSRVSADICWSFCSATVVVLVTLLFVGLALLLLLRYWFGVLGKLDFPHVHGPEKLDGAVGLEDLM